MTNSLINYVHVYIYIGSSVPTLRKNNCKLSSMPCLMFQKGVYTDHKDNVL